MQNVTLGKNLILFKQIASGSVTYATGAASGAVTSVTVATPVTPISIYMCTVKNNDAQNGLTLSFYNVRPIGGTTGVSFYLTTTSYASSVAKDVIVEGLFCGDSSGVTLSFAIASSTTAAEVVSADYQIWECR